MRTHQSLTSGSITVSSSRKLTTWQPSTQPRPDACLNHLSQSQVPAGRSKMYPRTKTWAHQKQLHTHQIVSHGATSSQHRACFLLLLLRADHSTTMSSEVVPVHVHHQLRIPMCVHPLTRWKLAVSRDGLPDMRRPRLHLVHWPRSRTDSHPMGHV